MPETPRSEVISLRQLEAFKAVVEMPSVTAAAASLHVSQPSVSRLLRSLEDAIGFALFERRKGRLVATPEAMLFYDEIQKYFRNMQRLAHTASDIRALTRGQLRVGAFVALAVAITPAVIRRFHAAHPQMHVSCATAQSRQIVDMVASRLADLGMVDPVAVTSGVQVERSWQFRCVCALPAGHGLAEYEIITAADLADANVIEVGREFLSRHETGTSLYRAIAPDLRIQVHQSITACALVAEGVGVAVVDPFTARQAAHSGIVIRPLKEAVPFDMCIVSSPEAPLSVAARKFLTLFDEELEKARRSVDYVTPL